MKNKMIPPTGIFAVLAVALIAGVVDAKISPKIVGGTEAALGEFPYQASLRYLNKHMCGGTIVSRRHIITAAHCNNVRPIETLSVVTGTISSTDGVHRPISSFVSHPDYDPKTVSSRHDIAVITLRHGISFNKNQNKIDLPTSPAPDGVTLTATGWGYTSADAKDPSPKLLKVELTKLSTTECQIRLGSISTVYPDQICTYRLRGYGVCMGDSGGPLAYKGKLVGVVSYGIPCGVGYPDVFTSVYHHRSWINQRITSSK